MVFCLYLKAQVIFAQAQKPICHKHQCCVMDLSVYKLKPITRTKLFMGTPSEHRRAVAGMSTGMKSPRKCLNPNWVQLHQKLKSNGSVSKYPRHDTEKEINRSILGKRKSRLEEDSEAVKPNPLIPTCSDSSCTDIVAMDCEMVGVSSLGNKSALGRVALVNKFGNVLLDEYVRPLEYVVDFRTGVSGIRPGDLRKAMKFSHVQKKVSEMIKSRVLVGHALHNDLKALMLTHPKKDIRDTSGYPPFLRNGRSRSLKNLAAEFLGVDIQIGEHCPIQDARAAMVLYLKNRKQWEKSVKDMARLKDKQKKRKRKNKSTATERS